MMCYACVSFVVPNISSHCKKFRGQMYIFNISNVYFAVNVQ